MISAICVSNILQLWICVCHIRDGLIGFVLVGPWGEICSQTFVVSVLQKGWSFFLFCFVSFQIFGNDAPLVYVCVFCLYINSTNLHEFYFIFYILHILYNSKKSKKQFNSELELLIVDYYHRVNKIQVNERKFEIEQLQQQTNLSYHFCSESWQRWRQTWSCSTHTYTDIRIGFKFFRLERH